ncbi:bifunctional [glutamine synthetase] adenylyltransferase/[glutamine synthetase]-adenylyl-L-tyrosine phosphorylase [Jatrophihabitans sp. YIM 134969]
MSGRLARLGFREPGAAAERLATLALPVLDRDSGEPTPDGAIALAALGRAAEPDLALVALERILDGGADRDLVWSLLVDDVGTRARLTSLLGASITLGEHLAVHPGDIAALRQVPPASVAAIEPVAAVMAERIVRSVGADPADPVRGSGGRPATLTGPDAVRALREAYWRELATVAAWDLAAEIGVETVCDLLTALADAVLAASLAVASAESGAADAAPFRLAVIAMGKTGGGELNYVSDVDVVFVAEPGAHDGEPGETEPALAAATRLAAGMMRVAGAAAWQVDAALRPEGRDGPLVRTLASHEAYYARWASTWEFQALLKARPAAGDDKLGRAYSDLVSPLVWSAAERPDFVKDVRAMRRRVVAHLPSDIAPREIKLGPGGLRDVEFVVQLLAMVHGRTDESLRARATLEVLNALRDGGYIGRDDAVSLADAYGFLRVAEHRLQLWRMQRTHTVPAGHDAKRGLARAMGFRPDDRGDAVAVFDAEWALHAREVRRLHERLFYRPLLESVARLPREELRLSKDKAADRLAALGFARPEQALSHLEALTRGVTRTTQIQRALLPVLLRAFADAPDPDAGLLAYRQVSDALGTTPWYLRLLRDEGKVASRLAFVLGASRYVAAMLVRAPEALRLLADDADLEPRAWSELVANFSDAALRQKEDDDGVAAVGVVRGLRRVELLRIAFADLLGLLDVDAVGRALADVADATVQAALSVAVRRAGEPARPFAVIGMGRLGGRETGYGSDADVLFVVDGDEGDHEAVSWGLGVAATVRRLLSSPSPDPAVQLDVDLRPEGRDGPVVRSLRSYAVYYERWSELWEAQALLRARPIAGDVALGERFMALVAPVRYPEAGLQPEQVLEIRRIKGRVESERLPRGADPALHAKLGRGGLTDVEWTVQLLQLVHGAQVPGLRTTSTLAALQAAVAAGLIDHDDADVLAAAWRLATRVRNAIRLVRDAPGDQVPTSGPVLALLATETDSDGDPGVVVDDYRRVTRHARQVVERLFYDRTPDDRPV